MLIRLFSAVIFLGAGSCLFLLLLNRVVINFKDGLPKTCASGIIGLSLTVIPGYFGYGVGFSRWLWIAILILAGITAGEIHRALVRYRCRGTPPVKRKNFHEGMLTRPLTATDLTVARYEIRHPDWQGQKLRIAHISDIHIHNLYPASYYEDIIKHISEVNPALVFITGDFVTKIQCVPLLPNILAPLAARYKTFAVLGNHDYWAGAEEIADTIRSCGIDLLGNSCHHIQVDNHKNVVICGDEYPWGPELLQTSFPPTDAFVIVLTHTPDNIYRLSATGVNVVFAGHYHAGQFRIPYLGSVVIPSVYGRRFDHGHFVVNRTHLFVTSGIGAANPPLRMYCQPDIFIVDFMEAIT